MLHLRVSNVASISCFSKEGPVLENENRRVTDGPCRQNWCATRARFAEASNTYELGARAVRAAPTTCQRPLPGMGAIQGGGKHGASDADNVGTGTLTT